MRVLLITYLRTAPYMGSLNGKLDAAMAEIERNFGHGSIGRLSDKPTGDIEVISSGSMALDAALGVGGYPRGRVVEIFGPESSGKSTICLHAVANAQTIGNVAYLDSEHALSPEYAAALGVDTDSLIVSQPDTAEQTIQIFQALVDSGDVALIVLDSVAALLPRAEMEGDVGDSHVGLLARIMSQAMRKLTGPLDKHGTTAIFVNQLRDTIGGFGHGPKETTSGGRALRYYASIRMDCRRIETERTGGEATSNRTRVKVVKNKCAPPFRQAEFSIIYGEGISREVEILDLAIEHGLIQKSGAWFKYEGSNIAQGRPKAVDWLKDNPVTCDELEATIRGMM